MTSAAIRVLIDQISGQNASKDGLILNDFQEFFQLETWIQVKIIMTSTNYRTIVGSVRCLHWSTIEQKYKEGVSYIVTAENRDTATRIRDLSHCFKVGKPPKLIVFGHNGLFNNGSCCYCAPQAPPRVNGRARHAAAPCTHRLCICQEGWRQFFYEPIISKKFQYHRKIKTCKYLPVSEIEL